MRIRRLLRILPVERRDAVLEQLSQSATPGFDFFLLVVLSCSIATWGLITNSPAVIIGAMLVAPLMSPILGLSLASVAGERRMFTRSLTALIQGALLAVALSAALGWTARLLPFDVLTDLPYEVLSRTHPTPFDLGIALAGGAAAAYALAQAHLSAALPGVAIATALMPPLCTVGIGLAANDTSVALGALLLFLTNLAAISFAGIAVFAFLGFRPVLREERWHGVPRTFFISASLVLIVTVPLVVLTLRFVGDARWRREVQEVVRAEVAVLPDAQIVEMTFGNISDSPLNLVVTVRTSRQPRHAEVVDLQSAIAGRLQRATALQLIVVPATRLDPLVPPTHTPTSTPGPSATPTPTATFTTTPLPTATATPSSTVTPTDTPTATPTDTPTPTNTPTPTPVPAVVGLPGGTVLRDEPNGRIIGFLPDSAPLQILYRAEVVNEIVWLEVRDVLNRVGWVRESHIERASPLP